MMLRRSGRRPGFTLLEVLLASAIAVVLLGALYVAFDLVLRQTDAGRDAVARGDLARGIVNRMSIDLAGCLGPLPPKSGGGVNPDAATTTTTTTTTTPAAATASTGTVADAADAVAPTETQVAADVPFQGGLFGSATQVTLFVSRVPPGLTTRETVATTGTTGGTQTQLPADLFRVTYYLAAGGGLCRQIRPWVTADGVRNSTDPDSGTEAADMIAEEVTDAQFEFFDGSSWAGQWDGSELQTDGKTPKGPPRAIRLTLTIQLAGAATSKQIQHVFPVRAAVGLYVPPVPETTTTGGM